MSTINIYDLDPKVYGTLLASDRMDVTDSAVSTAAGANKIPPDTHNRTILIGMGGTGLKTLNHIKRVIQQKLQPLWTKYIAFLAIDADRNEFDNAAYLDESEFVLSTLGGIKEVVDTGKKDYPSAWLPFVEEDAARALQNYGGNGSGRKRLMGKMKIHYANSESGGVDRMIMDRIGDMKNKQLAPVAGSESYQVYVIGSLSGGTCSGGFLEMPAMVRKALNAGDRVQVNAMLYLPDTVLALDPANRSELMANGYASLKELNYFEGMSMREGHSESWPCNDLANPELKLSNTDGFFTMPYLIGTVGGPKGDSDQVARETIAEFFISLLGNVIPAGQNAFPVDSFLNNALQRVGVKPVSTTYANGEMEAPNSAHEFPRRYGTIGFAQASAPEKIIQAYTLGRACVTAGLMPISNQERKNRITNGETFLPFLGEKQYSSSTDLNQQREEIMKSVSAFMARYQSAAFNYNNVITSVEPTWENIRDGGADDANVKRTVDSFVTKVTSSDSKKALENAVDEEYRKFRAAVKVYVEKNGPMAFYNLYMGIAEEAEKGREPAKGIKEVLQFMVDDQNVATGNPNTWPSHKVEEKRKNDLTQTIVKTKGGVVGKVLNVFNDEHTKQAGQWVAAYNKMVNARVNEERRKWMTGKQGILKKRFAEPVDTLAKQLYAFGKILESMANGYMQSGSKLDDFQTFSKVSDNSTEVNIAALNPAAHAWLQDEAASNAAKVDGPKVRKALVDSFFDHPADWLEVDDRLLNVTGESITLVSEEAPVKARKMFDEAVGQTISINMDITVDNLFVQLQARNVDYKTYAKQIVDELARKSLPLFNSIRPFDARDRYCYIMYPQALKKNNPNVVQELENEAKLKFPNAGFYGTDYADSIMMYQMVAPFEVYQLADLPQWEREYEVMIRQLNNGLHGKSPDVKRTSSRNSQIDYVENTSWYDYPAITYRENPQARDENGDICHEGQVRNKMDKVIDEAIKMGLLYCEERGGRYYVVRVRMDDSVEWDFDDSLLRVDPKTELYPMGIDLIKTVAKQNRVRMEDITRTVSLANAGLMTDGHVDEEWAWKYARRVLYAHRPMFNQIRDTIDRVRPWHEAVEELNKGLMDKYKPAKMIRLMMAKVFYPDDDQIWTLLDADGMETPVVNMSDSQINRLTRRDPMGAAVVNAGFSLYYIYTKLASKVDDKELDAALTYAKEVLDEYRDEETLDAAFDMTDKMMKEQTKALVALGADLDNPEKKPLKAFVNKMAAVEIEDEEQIMALCDFYSKLKFWKKV